MARRDGPDEFAVSFGKRLRELRTDLGISLRDIERDGGIRRGHLGDLERGRASPTVRTIEALARALGLQPFELLVDPERSARDRIAELVRGMSGEDVQWLVAAIRSRFEELAERAAGVLSDVSDDEDPRDAVPRRRSGRRPSRSRLQRRRRRLARG